MEHKNVYKTKDFPLACYFLASGQVKLLDLDKSNLREIYFIFDNPALCRKLVNQFINNEAMVNARDLIYRQRELRELMNKK